MRVGPFYIRAGRFHPVPVKQNSGDLIVVVSAHALERAETRLRGISNEGIVADMLLAIDSTKTRESGQSGKGGQRRLTVTGELGRYVVERRRKGLGWFVITALESKKKDL